MKLSRHFDSDEFRSRDGAPLPDRHLREIRALVLDYLQPARDRFGRCTVLSGHRSRTHNANVGGARQSRHLDLPGKLGAAADVKFARGTVGEWHDFFDSCGVGGLGRYATYVHVDNRPGRARW